MPLTSPCVRICGLKSAVLVYTNKPPTCWNGGQPHDDKFFPCFVLHDCHWLLSCCWQKQLTSRQVPLRLCLFHVSGLHVAYTTSSR